eukprot:COSAG02_NODE_23367_length_721_cov_0.726688_1_plen_155_part_10
MACPKEGKDCGSTCFICLEPGGRTRGATLLRCGCSCSRAGSSGGAVHLSCAVQAAQHNEEWWYSCPTCTQQWTGELQLELGRKRWDLAKGRPALDGERLAAVEQFSTALACAGKYQEALPLLRHNLHVSRQARGNGDDGTQANFMVNLAALLSEM